MACSSGSETGVEMLWGRLYEYADCERRTRATSKGGCGSLELSWPGTGITLYNINVKGASSLFFSAFACELPVDKEYRNC